MDYSLSLYDLTIHAIATLYIQAVLSRPRGPANRRLPSRTLSEPAVLNNQSNHPKISAPTKELSRPVYDIDSSQSKSCDLSGDTVGPEERESVADGWRPSGDEVDGPLEVLSSKELSKKIHCEYFIYMQYAVCYSDI